MGGEQGETGEITDVQFFSKKRHPIVVTFQNGELLPDAVERLKCGVYRDKKTGERIVAVASESRVYFGSPASASSKLCRTLLAIRNKQTNKVRLVEVESVNLSPIVQSEKPAAKEMQNLQAYTKLSRTFGSKRAKRSVEQREAMQLEVEHMEHQLSQALSTTALAKKATASPLPEETRNVSSPATVGDEVVPCDRTATTPDKIYDLHDLVSEDELNSFSEEAETLISGGASSVSYSPFFNSCFKEVPAETRVQSIKILLYAECLIRFVSLTYKDLRAKNVSVCPQSESISTRILNNFTVASDSGRTRPLHVRDKAICHVIVLGLLANKFKLNVEPLLASIKIGATRLQQLCRAIGAVPSVSNKNIVVLKAPLPPLTSVGGGGGGAGRNRRTGRGGRQQ
ncbi:uncharacterized protein LOC124789066 [Schistocerca piceifrons]|uniref:uncharacterized protein LOC124789066 n=1 Tax=Schistocerca piceifrons TaxID=274613 RepID=UPI001F5F77D7|nr:uncharacterized protein LOC124789066 [Schistocerca piceifrons]